MRLPHVIVSFALCSLILIPSAFAQRSGGGHMGGGGFRGGGGSAGGGFRGGAPGGGFRGSGGSVGGNFRGGFSGGGFTGSRSFAGSGFRGGFSGDRFRSGSRVFVGSGGYWGYPFGYSWGYPYAYGSYGYPYSYDPYFYDPYYYNYGYVSQPYPPPPARQAAAPAYTPSYDAPRSNQSFYRAADFYLIAFTDGTVQTALSYRAEDDTLYWTTRTHAEKQAPLSTVDRRFSEQLNRDRRVEFTLP